jgi:hypothetical protein
MTPDVRSESESLGRVTGCGCTAAAPEPELVPVRVITAEQLDRAVVQLRERRGRPAAEQMCAVLRALELTVLPAVEHRR